MNVGWVRPPLIQTEPLYMKFGEMPPMYVPTDRQRGVIDPWQEEEPPPCATCGEPANSTIWPGRCKRCERAIEDERERDW